jgi:hypothetical protein
MSTVRLGHFSPGQFVAGIFECLLQAIVQKSEVGDVTGKGNGGRAWAILLRDSVNVLMVFGGVEVDSNVHSLSTHSLARSDSVNPISEV